MTAIAVDIDLTPPQVIQFSSKLAYLEKTNQQLQERCDDLASSASTSKSMLHSALEQLSLLKSNDSTVEAYRKYADESLRVLTQQVETLSKRLSSEVELRRRQTSRVLISEQIREEEAAFYREVVKEYEAKILELLLSVQEKEHHVQMLEEADSENRGEIQRPKLPTRQIMKLINDYDINLALVERYKLENEQLRAELDRQRAAVQRLVLELEKSKTPEDSRLILSEQPSTNGGELESEKKNRSQVSLEVKHVDSNCKTASSLTQSATKSKSSPKKNQTLFESMVTLYKREQTNSKLMAKKIQEIQERLAAETHQKRLLQESNVLLQERLMHLTSTERLAARQWRNNGSDIKSKTEEKASSDKSLQDNLEKQKAKAEERGRYVAELYSRFRQQLLLLEEHLSEVSQPRRKLTYSLSCYELALSQPATECSEESEKLSFKKDEPSPEDDLSVVMQCDNGLAGKLEGQTFGEYISKHARADNSLFAAFDAY